jgi:hypothetical protein
MFIFACRFALLSEMEFYIAVCHPSQYTKRCRTRHSSGLVKATTYHIQKFVDWKARVVELHKARSPTLFVLQH